MANYVLTQTGQEVQDILDSMGATYFFSQSVSSWNADATYPDYPYKGTISLAGVDGTMGVEVSFSNDQAISGNYSPICNTTNDAVEIWSKVNTSITIPTIKIYKNGYVNLNGSSNYMPQSGGNFTGMISVNSSNVITQATIKTFTIDVTTLPMGGSNIYTGELNVSSDPDVSGARAVIPLWARKSGYSYFCPCAYENGAIRVQSTISLSGVTAGILILR